ncbi:MAG: MscL family protein [Acidimicrobiales bacterium]
MKGFKDFLLKGNLVAAAVAFVMALAFQALIKAFVASWITPSIALASGGKGNFANSGFYVGKVLYPWGSFINALIAFIIIAAVVYFAIVIPFNRLMARMGMGPAPTKNCPECEQMIPLSARRCQYCSSPQPDVVGAPSTQPE